MIWKYKKWFPSHTSFSSEKSISAKSRLISEIFGFILRGGSWLQKFKTKFRNSVSDVNSNIKKEWVNQKSLTISTYLCKILSPMNFHQIPKFFDSFWEQHLGMEFSIRNWRIPFPSKVAKFQRFSKFILNTKSQILMQNSFSDEFSPIADIFPWIFASDTLYQESLVEFWNYVSGWNSEDSKDFHFSKYIIIFLLKI